jgi:hypothetical protein
MPSRVCSILTLLAALLSLVLPASVLAALPGAGSPLSPSEVYPSASHAWAVVPASSGRGYVLVHLPPRVANDGRPGTPAGAIRSGFRLEEAPETMAAFGKRVYLFFRPKPRGDDQHTTQRAIFTQSVRRFAQSELWVDEPTGRLETLPAIADAGDLLAAAADDRGPLVLVEHAGVIRLLALDGEKWNQVPLPAEVQTALRARNGPAALAVEGSEVALAARVRGELFVARTAALRSDTPQWQSSSVPVEGLANLRGDFALFLALGRWIVIEPADPARLSLHAVTGGTLTQLCTFGVPNPVRTITMQPGAGRCIVISTTSGAPRDPASAFAQDAPTRVTEVSLLTGEVLYDDRIHAASPLGTNEFRFLAVVLMLAMAMVLVLVLRGQPDAIHLPDGLALAEPVRRIVAGVLDIALVSLILPRVVGHGLFDLFNPQVWISGDAIRVLVALAAMGTAIGAIGEWLFGRSPGKLMTDCEVISVAAPPAAPVSENRSADAVEIPRPSLAACVLRNAVKWFLSPVAMLALMDDTGRHRGDQIARAAVVVEIREEDHLDDVE